MTIIDLVKDLYGYSPSDLIKQIKKNFTVDKTKILHLNQKNLRSFGMYLDKQLVFNWNLKKNPEKNLFRIINLDINILH